MAILEYKIRTRRDTAANFSTHNPTLMLGELALETDTKKMKVGDGVTAWNGLGYEILTLSLVGEPGGLTPLNGLGKVDPSYIDQVSTATSTAFTPSGNISATNVQTAIQELDTEKQAVITATTGSGNFVRAAEPDIRFTTVTQSGNYTVLLSDYTIRASGTTTQTITLPDATTCSGKLLNIKKVGATSSKVFVTAFPTQTIDNSASVSISLPLQNLTIQSNGTGWDII